MLQPLHVSVKTVRSGQPSNGQLSVTAEFDVFAQQNQKVVTSYVSAYNSAVNAGNFKDTFDLKSSGLSIDVQLSREAGFDRETYSGEYVTRVLYQVGTYTSIYWYNDFNISLSLIFWRLR